MIQFWFLYYNYWRLFLLFSVTTPLFFYDRIKFQLYFNTRYFYSSSFLDFLDKSAKNVWLERQMENKCCFERGGVRVMTANVGAIYEVDFGPGGTNTFEIYTNTLKITYFLYFWGFQVCSRSFMNFDWSRIEKNRRIYTKKFGIRRYRTWI